MSDKAYQLLIKTVHPLDLTSHIIPERLLTEYICILKIQSYLNYNIESFYFIRAFSNTL